MKFTIYCFAIFASINLAYSVPVLNYATVVSNYLLDGEIKVYNGGPTEIFVRLNATRFVNEAVNMDVEFCMYDGTNYHVLKTTKITTNNFAGSFLNTNFGDVLVSIPENLNTGVFRVRYKYLDLDPSSSYYNEVRGPYYLNKTYQTIDMTPEGPPIPAVWNNLHINHGKKFETLANAFAEREENSSFRPSLQPVLTTGQRLYSHDDAYFLSLQADGNLVIYDSNTHAVKWGSNSTQNNSPSATYELYFQFDGNLVLHKKSGGQSQVIWAANNTSIAANTPFSANAQYGKFMLQPDGNMVLHYKRNSEVAYIICSTGSGSVVSNHFGQLK